MDWNTFGYPVQVTRAIAAALASIEGKYSAVASYEPNQAASQTWRTYFVTVTDTFSSMVNTLTEPEYTRAYWLYATEAVTLYLGAESSQSQTQLPKSVDDGQ